MIFAVCANAQTATLSFEEVSPDMSMKEQRKTGNWIFPVDCQKEGAAMLYRKATAEFYYYNTVLGDTSWNMIYSVPSGGCESQTTTDFLYVVHPNPENEWGPWLFLKVSLFTGEVTEMLARDGGKMTTKEWYFFVRLQERAKKEELSSL